ncbi:MAG: universal stress protein [Caulobacteraceae bacterium]
MAKILAALDGSTYALSVCDHAAWFARRLSASVELLHVIDRGENARAQLDLSGSVGLGASETLLEELARVDEAQGRIARQQGQVLLEGAARRLREAGVQEVSLVHRYGEAADTLISLEADADLVVMGKRGEGRTAAQNHLGSKVERIVRGSIRPVLVVPRIFMPVTRAVVAFDGSASARRALLLVATSPGFTDLARTVVIVGEAGAQTQGLATEAERAFGGGAADVRVVGGAVEAGLKSQLRHSEGDLLVMGAYGHSRIRELIVGSTTTTMIRTSKLPVLLFR